MTPAGMFTLHTLRPDPGQARDWVRAELAKHEYQPSLLERVTRWLFDKLDAVLRAAGGLGHLSAPVAAIALIILVVGAAFVLARLRPTLNREQNSGPVRPEVRVSASEHRRLAEQALLAEQYDEVVVEAMRALTVGLVERAVLDDVPAATAREVAQDASAAFPALASSLHTAAELFDAVRYGDRHADRDAAGALLVLEETVRLTRPVEAAARGPVLAVPR